MRKLIAVIVGLFLCSTVHAAGLGTVRKIFEDTPVATQTSATSTGILIKSGGYFGVWYKAVSAPTAAQFVSSGGKAGVDIKIEVQQSYNDVNGNYIEPTDLSDIETNFVCATATATNVGLFRVKNLILDPMTYVRFVATGNGSNNTPTTITMYLFQQE